MKNTKSRVIKLLLATFFGLSLFGAILPGQSAIAAKSSLWSQQVGLGSGSNNIGSAFGQSTTNPTDIRLIITRVARVMLEFLGIVLLILILFAGYKYMMAQGNAEEAKKALKMITQAVIGLLITVCAFALTDYIIQVVLDVQDGSTGFYLFRFK